MNKRIKKGFYVLMFGTLIRCSVVQAVESSQQYQNNKQCGVRKKYKNFKKNTGIQQFKNLLREYSIKALQFLGKHKGEINDIERIIEKVEENEVINIDEDSDLFTCEKTRIAVFLMRIENSFLREAIESIERYYKEPRQEQFNVNNAGKTNIHIMNIKYLSNRIETYLILIFNEFIEKIDDGKKSILIEKSQEIYLYAMETELNNTVEQIEKLSFENFKKKWHLFKCKYEYNEQPLLLHAQKTYWPPILKINSIVRKNIEKVLKAIIKNENLYKNVFKIINTVEGAKNSWVFESEGKFDEEYALKIAKKIMATEYLSALSIVKECKKSFNKQKVISSSISFNVNEINIQIEQCRKKIIVFLIEVLNLIHIEGKEEIKIEGLVENQIANIIKQLQDNNEIIEKLEKRNKSFFSREVYINKVKNTTINS